MRVMEFGFVKLTRNIKWKNFTIVFEKKNATDNVNFSNFINKVDKIEYLDLMFEKK